MDLFAKDHPLEAAALRMRSPKEEDNHSAAEDDDESYASEHEKFPERSADLMIEFGASYEMHTEIMRTNKKIQEEAAAILYGESRFTESFYDMEYQPLDLAAPRKGSPGGPPL
ncbi:MAG: hypothetical protein Q9161_000573 [Pseudevernia consocians]